MNPNLHHLPKLQSSSWFKPRRPPPLIIDHNRTKPSNSYHFPPTSSPDNFPTSSPDNFPTSDHPESLHQHFIKKGFFPDDLFLSNNLINLYSRAGDLPSARKVFDEIPLKNSVTWTCLIAGYTRQSRPDEAFTLFRTMLASGSTRPTHFTFGSILRACQDSGPYRLHFGVQIHGLVSKTQYATDTTVCNALVSMYGNIESGRVFESMKTKTLISWNAIISVDSFRGDVVSVFNLFSRMHEEGIEPNEYTFGSLISSSYHYYAGSCLLDQLLARVSKSGLSGDLFVGSALVSAFSRCGSLETAREILVRMSFKNVVSMNGLMVGLVKRNLGEEALEVFREMRGSVELTCDSHVVLLSAIADFKVAEEGRRKGREVHGFVTTTGMIDHKVAIKNGLVNMYANCSAIEEARSVFKGMSERDVISWNSIISGFDHNGLFEEALTSFGEMIGMGTMPSNFSIISSLSSCASLRILNTGSQVHCVGIRVGLDTDVSVSNSLLKMYGECGSIAECWKIFKLMPDHDQISWNSMIGMLAKSEMTLNESFGAFLDMMRGGWKPNKVTFVNLLAALTPLSVLELGRQVHGLALKHGVTEDTAVENALLSCYAKSGDMDSCECIFGGMTYRRDDVSWNSMIAGYIHNGLLPKAMDLVWLMMHNGQNMDFFTLSTVLSACASVAALERGMESHAFGLRLGLQSDVVVESSLIDMYSKCGRIDYASKVFKAMPLKNEFSWNSMISGYARHGQGQKALEIFKEMQSGNLRPNHVTFVGVLSACSHAGLLEQGLDYFDSMSQVYGLVPQMEHYSCVVDLLGRSGRLDDVEDFIRRMPMTPNILIWRTVLVACYRSKDGSQRNLGKLASEMLLELEPENPVNYILAANLHASRGRWNDVAMARAAMRGVPAKKEAGCSWVTLKDGLYVFVAGDRTHPNTEEIYAKLRVLSQKMKALGYVPKTEFALYDLEVENKEELLSYHSEKLAVAFVLTRSSGSSPIRIMKNLRVCGDCHSAFEYISQIVRRQIILRDFTRFHHFADGKCSCGGYW